MKPKPSPQTTYAILADLRDRILCGEAHLKSIRLLAPGIYDASHKRHITTVVEILRTMAYMSPTAARRLYDNLAPQSKPTEAEFAAAIACKMRPPQRALAEQMALAQIVAHHIQNI